MATETTHQTVAAVLRALAGGVDTALPLLAAAIPGGFSPPVQLAVRGVGAALGLVAELVERAQDPVVQIEAWRSALSEVATIDNGAERQLEAKGE